MPSGTTTLSRASTTAWRGPGAGLGHRRDPPADQVRVAAGADREHPADQVVARGEGERRLAEVAAPAHRLLGVGDAGGLDLDEQLAGGRVRQSVRS